MNIIDTAAAAVICIFMILGIKRGLISEVFRFTAVIGGIGGAYLFYRDFRPHLSFIDLPPRIETPLSFLILFLAIALSLFILGWFIKKLIHTAMMGWLDRLLGGVFGAVKGFIIIILIGALLSVVPAKGVKNELESSAILSFSQSPPFNLTLPDKMDVYNNIRDNSLIKEIRDKGNTLKPSADLSIPTDSSEKSENRDE
ncbi:MAG: CvpA family protein [Chitinivibrionales bacterium]